MAGAASQAGDADSSRAPGLTSGLQGSVNVHRGDLLLVPQWQYISSFVFYIFVTLVPFAVWELVVQFPARGSTQVLLWLFPGVLWLWHFLYSVGPHPVSSFHIYPLLCRGDSWRVRLAKQETLTPPRHQLVLPLLCRVRECTPWCSIVGATVTVYQFFCILHCNNGQIFWTFNKWN